MRGEREREREAYIDDLCVMCVVAASTVHAVDPISDERDRPSTLLVLCIAVLVHMCVALYSLGSCVFGLSD